jgi:hypothetical protein
VVKGARYWECFLNGHGCGIHHRSSTAAQRHCDLMNRDQRRRRAQARTKNRKPVDQFGRPLPKLQLWTFRTLYEK